MLPIFERALGHPNLKNKYLRVIVKMHTYILQRGERFTSKEHREGLGENIKAVGIYYPEISNIKGGNLVVTAESAPSDRSRDPVRVTKLCLRDFALALRWSVSTVPAQQKTDTCPFAKGPQSFLSIAPSIIRLLWRELRFHPSPFRPRQRVRVVPPL